jgi:superfamily II DNA or RNA helicase
MEEYIYISTNNDWNYEKKFKYGYTKNPLQRIINNHEAHSYLSTYISIYKIKITVNYKLPYTEYDKIISIISRDNDIINSLKKYYDNDLTNLSNISKYLVEHDGSTEFIYEDCLDIFNNILLTEFSILGLEVEKIDISNINNKIKEHKKSLLDYKENILKLFSKKEFIIRPYQSTIITEALYSLKNTSKFYLELATGGGKSMIIYNIINELKPEIVIIFSPRTIINQQNVKKEYLNILNEKYDVIYDIVKPISKKTIIVSCIQSFYKIYESILQHNIKNIFMWFDESHWSIENWCNDLDNIAKNFLLNDTNNIKYRIFTSASPNKEIILKNKQIFGELYLPIKVKELIKQKWLCDIIPHVFSVNKNDPDIINYIIKGFIDNNKKFGFSFHNCKDNAYNLFIKHYKHYIEKITNIKPFLLISDYFSLDINKITLDYNYKDIATFENTEYNIGYVVSQYNIGYDFHKIDILFMSDPKLSFQDITQSFGRGMRPDKLDINGSNLNKKLDIYLPVYVENDDANKYNNMKEVLKYLLYDIELNIKDIKFDNLFDTKQTDKKLDHEDIYQGTEEVKSIILNLIKYDNKKLWNCKKITEHLCKNNIHNLKDYKEYIKNNDELGMPENIFITFPDFIWYNTYKKDKCPYYNKLECIKIIKKLDENELYLNYDDDEKIKYLNNLDNKIPTESLWRFYGGCRDDYFR